uniref:Cysteine-rich repeat secretory protein 38 n=1 Tax=Anthurium amnicola TaxID=1678845 RepID=A0A1D1Y8C8_9ARAE
MNTLSFVVLSLIPLSLLLRSAAGAEPLNTICSSSGNYTAADPFTENLGRLLGSLSVTTPPTGFGVGSVGYTAGGRAYGLALCRGDVQSVACKACVVDAGNQIRRRCPHRRGAVIWFDNCLLRYSDEDFVGVVDGGNRFYARNVQRVPDSAAFARKVAELMGGVAAVAHVSPRLFATGVSKAGEDGTLYGLAQCTRDLSGGDCSRCLESAVGELPTCCSGRRGARVVGASCNIRYELYPFF